MKKTWPLEHGWNEDSTAQEPTLQLRWSDQKLCGLIDDDVLLAQYSTNEAHQRERMKRRSSIRRAGTRYNTIADWPYRGRSPSTKQQEYIESCKSPEFHWCARRADQKDGGFRRRNWGWARSYHNGQERQNGNEEVSCKMWASFEPGDQAESELRRYQPWHRRGDYGGSKSSSDLQESSGKGISRKKETEINTSKQRQNPDPINMCMCEL